MAVEVVKWCDELCLGWRSVNDCRDHLDKVKAQSYIDKYEMKLCEASIDCETAFESVKALINVANDNRVRESGGVSSIIALLELVVQAAGIAKSEGWKCPDLLEAVSRDVITFSKEMGIASRLAPTAWAPASHSHNSTNKTIATKTFKRTTKPSVQKARQGNNRDLARRRVRPEQKVLYNNNSSSRSTCSSSTDINNSRDSRQRNNLGSSKRRQQPVVNLSSLRRSSSRKVRGNIPQPELAVSAVNYDMSSNPFAVKGSNGRR